MSKPTALEVFALELYAKGLLKGNGDEIQESLERHKHFEKQQIGDAYKRGFISDDIKLADDYYTETFGETKN
jgi:hypothetical protein